MNGNGRENNQAGLLWLASFVQSRWRGVAFVLALSVFATGLGLVQPWLTKILIDDGLMARQLGVVFKVSGVLLAVALVSLALGAVNRRLYVTLSSDILFAIREAVYAHLQRLSPEFHARRDGGDLMARLDGDIAEIQRFSTDSLFALVSALIGLAGSLALLIVLNWKLSLLAFVLLPAQIMFLRHMRPRVEAQTRTLRERTGDITGFLMERLPAMKFIQSVAGEAAEEARLHHLNRIFFGDLLRLQMTSYFTGAVPGFMTTLSTAIVFMAGGYLVVKGQMTLGALIAFSVYLARATGPVQTFLGLYVAYQRVKVSLVRVVELTTERPGVEEAPDALAVADDAQGEITLEDVSFRYGGRGGLVLDGACATFLAGQKIGIRGASGVGKSTLIDLLQRLYDPSDGRILLDGRDLRCFRLASLRRAVGVVAQDTILFRATISDNIRYARPSASDGEVRAAAQRAGIHAFIKTLPEGYDTDTGMRGTALSGGQRQRLSIARALLQDPLVLVLDEATSAVDRETEHEIIAAIDTLFAQRTRIVISHRDDILAGCTSVYNMVAGKLSQTEVSP